MTRSSASPTRELEGLSKDRAELLQLLLEQQARRAHQIKRSPRSEDSGPIRFPTSWAQQRLWFIDHLEGGTAAYNIPMAMRLRGALDRQALRQSLDALVQRHESLRTVFANVNGEPEQQIAPESPVPLQEIDLSGRAEDDRRAQVRLHQGDEAHRKFDLSRGPLMRGRLLRLQEQEYVLLLTFHHIVFDGWSIGVLFREIEELYAGYRQGSTPALGALPIQYADYAQWQRQWLQGPLLEEQLAYWRTHLAGAPPQLELPTDRPRPPIQSYRGANVEVLLDRQLSSSLRSFAQQQGMTLFMVLYATWALLLARLSGQDDIVVGTPIANRRRPELEGLIGFFVNTLALRVRISLDMPVAQLLGQVKNATLAAYAHQDVPFEKVVDALQPERSLDRNPLFQVMFALQNAPRSELSLAGLAVSEEPGVEEPSIFDLFVTLEERGEEIRGSVYYATDLFDRDTIRRWMASFERLLRSLPQNADACVGDLPILTESEEQLLHAFNATRVACPDRKLVHELFEEQAARTPTAIAVIGRDHSLSYAQLNAGANQLARYLRSRGVVPDQPVAIAMERSPEMIMGLLAILKTGAAYMPLDPNYPTERLRHMLEDATPRVVLTHDATKSLLPQTSAAAISLDDISGEIAGHPDGNLPVSDCGLTPENLLYVIYTSGSTGRPKGTAMPHRALVNLLDWHRRNLETEPEQRVLQFAALSFDVAFQETFSTLCAGGTLVLLTEAIRKDPRELLQFMRDFSIRRFFVPPLMLQSLAEHCRATNAFPESLREIIAAGEQLRITPEIRELFRHLDRGSLHNHYGPTETHVVTAFTLPRDPSTWPTLPGIGRPVTHCQIHILDPLRNPVPIGVVGEIYIGGAGVARGYLHRPELTAERFLADPFSREPSARLYKTGDLGRWRADGTIEYLGRNDHQVKIRGFRIELGEIEAQLARDERVKDVAIVAREDAAGQKRLVAYVVPHVQVTGAELREVLKAHLPDYMIPSAWVMLDRLPSSPNGKLDRRALPIPEWQREESTPYVAPATELECTLASIWAQVLRVDRVGVDDNFFELGGHSLLATQVVARIEAALSIEVPIRLLFERPTIRELRVRVDELRHAGLIEDIEAGGAELEELLEQVTSMSERGARDRVRE